MTAAAWLTWVESSGVILVAIGAIVALFWLIRCIARDEPGEDPHCCDHDGTSPPMCVTSAEYEEF